jgi:hydrogenase maturation protein HypF
VRNETDGVLVEAYGEGAQLRAFIDGLHTSAPALARISSIEVHEEGGCVIEPGERELRIERSSTEQGGAACVTPDAATCADCLRELFDPDDRRAGHAFVNCTSCGPRLTIVRSVPYDRARTTMASFAMCSACQAEYEDATDRRFHAQPNACPACGPQLAFHRGGNGTPEEGAPIDAAARALAAGEVLSIKGLGGYHLACDARNEDAVATLRARKQRDAKPFAIMVSSALEAMAFCDVSSDERALLESSARPIVLLARSKAPASARLPENLAPGLDRLGVMLAYTPLHHLLVRAVGFPLVMTSGNVADEPIAAEDADARTRLGPLVDATLTHDRPIHVRCDDSIAHVVLGAPAVLRRSRGYAPAPLDLPSALSEPTLALGGHLKAVLALGTGTRAFASHHLGDLEHPAAWASYREAIAHYVDLLRISPARVVHDLHPDYATTALAHELEASGLARIAVQHHEAHVAGCLAENRVTGDAIGVAFDGAGYGHDGAVWGGELFVGRPGHLRRRGHLRYVGLVGGDVAAREPWRMAVAHARAAGVSLDPRSLGAPAASVAAVERLLERNARGLVADTSSIGRLFDAVAALTGLRSVTAYEAQAAMELEASARRFGSGEPYSFAIEGSGTLLLDPREMIREIARDVARGVETGRIAYRFHATIAAMTTAACVLLRESSGAGTVALTGGVFANVLLAELTTSRLAAASFVVVRHSRVPTGDGGLSYGQLASVAGKDEH